MQLDDGRFASGHCAEYEVPLTPFLVDVVVTDETTVVRFVGELDMATVARAEGRTREALTRCTTRRFAIEASELTFCDSTGLTLLLRLMQAARDAGRQAAVVRPSANVRRVIEATKLEAVLLSEDRRLHS